MLGRHYASRFLSGECTYSALVFPVRRACTPYTVIEISHSVFPTQNMHTFFHRHRKSTIHLLSTARTPCTRSIKVHPIQDVSCQVLRLKALRGVRGGLSRKSSPNPSQSFKSEGDMGRFNFKSHSLGEVYAGLTGGNRRTVNNRIGCRQCINSVL